MPEFSEESLKKIAKQKVKRRLFVQIHASAFAGVNLLLFIVNWLTFSGYLWALWPVCSWAVGLTMHLASYLIWVAGVPSGSRVGFLYHLTAYLTVNIYLVFVWWMAGGGFLWFLFPLVFWGIGLLIHRNAVAPRVEGKSWMDKKVEQELAKIQPDDVKGAKEA